MNDLAIILMFWVLPFTWAHRGASDREPPRGFPIEPISASKKSGQVESEAE